MERDLRRNAYSNGMRGSRRLCAIRSTERPRQLQHQQSSMSETLYVLPNEELDTERDVKVQEWKTLANARPLKFLVAGRGGVGKSSLINNLLELNRTDGASEGFTGGATTQAVGRYTSSKHGIEVIAYDTPGFHDLQLKDEDIIAELVDKTGSMVDVCLYCASLETRICQEDKKICSLLTMAFNEKLWQTAIFVLTFANSERITRSNYETTVERYKSNLKDCLKNAGVTADKISNISFCTAGYTDPQLVREDCRNWQDRLYVEIIKKADPAVTPALLKLRWGPEAVRWAVGGSAAGAASGAVVGAGIGAGVGLLGGPLGLAVGAATGGITGAVVGAVFGPASATGMRALHSDDLKTIVKAKYMLYKMQQKKKRKSLCSQQ